jgi:hypothetical protein
MSLLMEFMPHFNLSFLNQIEQMANKKSNTNAAKLETDSASSRVNM